MPEADVAASISMTNGTCCATLSRPQMNAPGAASPAPGAYRRRGSGQQGRACLGSRHDPGVLLNLAVLAVQRPAAEQEAADDRAAGEDASDPPERRVVAVRQRQPEHGLAADQPGRGDM